MSGTGDTGQRDRADLQLVVGGRSPSTEADERLQARASKARDLDVASDASMDALIEAVLGECLRHVLANRAAARSADDPEGVHQLRVGLRRTQSALRLFGDALHPGRTKVIRGEIRRIGRKLAAARDWDVFVAETLAPIAAELPDEDGLQRLRALAEAERLAAHDAVRRALESKRFDRSVASLGAYLREGGWRPKPTSKRARRLDEPAKTSAARLLEARARRVRGLGRRVGELSERDLHRLRIRVKQLRYAGEFLAPLFPGEPARRFLKRVARLQDELGHVNDGRVAEALVERVLRRAEPGDARRVDRAAGLVIGWSHRGALARRAAVRRSWERLADAADFWAP